MDKLLQKIFTQYFDEEADQRIFKDKDYIEKNKVLTDLEAKTLDTILNNHLDEESIRKIIEEMSYANANLSSIYRYYDFSEGLAIGIILGINCRHFHNPDFYKEISSYIEKMVNNG